MDALDLACKWISRYGCCPLEYEELLGEANEYFEDCGDSCESTDDSQLEICWKRIFELLSKEGYSNFLKLIEE